MTTLDIPASAEIMDFSSPQETIKFRVDDDVFEASPEIAAISMMRFAESAERFEDEALPVEEKIRILQNMFRLILLPESAGRFIRRMEDDTHPIGMRQFLDVIKWLMEQYGLRPTESDSPS